MTNVPASDTDLIVPVRVRTLMVNDKVKDSDGFCHWNLNFTAMIGERAPAEPPVGRENYDLSFGLRVQWELPEALTRGHYDPETGETAFPLVPNRWLVVRYFFSPKDQVRKAAGWVVHSDYLKESDYPDAGLGHGTSRFATTRGRNPEPHADRIGRKHDLANGPWREPESRELFLTAVGPGIPAFAAFAPFHQDVFMLHDTLEDIKAEDPLNTYPPNTEISYQVIGWYSDPGRDILAQAPDIPGLLPPDHTPADILTALGWSAPHDAPAAQRTFYAGTSLGIPWKQRNFYPESDMPDPLTQTVAIGHSTADAAGALVTRQTRNPRTGDLIRALFEGTIDTYGTVEGDIALDEALRSAWFAGHDGGYVWQITPRPSDEPVELPPVPGWLAELNARQAQHDALSITLQQAQSRLWTLWWLRHHSGEHPAQFDAAVADAALDLDDAGSLAARTRTLLAQAAQLLRQVPHGLTPEELQEAIDAYVRDPAHPLPNALELRRTAREPFHHPADPVVVIEGAGTTEPLSRDADDPLPCRIPSRLLRRVHVDGNWKPVPASPLAPNLADLPAVCRALIAECDLLDQAFRAPSDSSSGNALADALSDPDNKVDGTLAEYTAVWKQPWAPMYLQWELRYCPTPYHSDGTDHWEFDGSDYVWKGTGAERSGENSTGDAQMRWLVFRDRAFLTPTVPYVLRGQIKRYLDTYPTSDTAGLQQLRDDYEEMHLLSQTLDGFNDWLLQQDGAARMMTPAGSQAALFGDPQSVPNPGPAADFTEDQDRFQPVRAGQFFFASLRIIDRFSRFCDITNLVQENYQKLDTVHADSVKPDAPLYEGVRALKRFFQLPPRLLQDSRVRFDPAHAGDSARYTGVVDASTVDTSPVVGWLMLNHLDRTMLVYAPDGAPLGELRVVGDQSRTAWNALPHAPHACPEDFAEDFPQLSRMLVKLLAKPPAAFDQLVDTIDATLATITDPDAQEDRSPTRLIGRPVALIRAALDIELRGAPLTSPSWDVLDPPHPEYPDYRWPIRLGDPQRLTDGLIGYFASSSGPGGATDYTVLNAVAPESGSDYVQPIEFGYDLALPARPGDDAVTHHLTLLADPHVPVHATTGILPVAALALDADLVHQALARIRASFRLDPLLAPARTVDQEAESPLGSTDGHPIARLLDGNLGTYWLSREHVAQGGWVLVDLGKQRTVHRIDILPGDLTGGFSTPATVLECSTDGTPDTASWTELGTYAARQEIHHDTTVQARLIRLRFTAAQGHPVALRAFTVATDAPGSGLVMPRPASWHGDWTWAEPHVTTAQVPDWGELPIVQSDNTAHPDDPVPQARAGYLQLSPAHDA
ncbi:discoidin domain-containing protein [Kitasatospora sp. NPDC056273]|uniref:discoidin domain-containing protein n=1 Tax=Kitasatospora sp. NPDC056273 TaxID=3345769 RepID=UPI0035DE32F0